MNPCFNESRARRLMGEAGVAALITGHPPNLSYVTGYDSALLRQRHVIELGVFALEAEPTLILPVVEVPRALDFPATAAKLCPFGQFFVYEHPGAPVEPLFRDYRNLEGQRTPNLRAALGEALGSVGRSGDTVAFDDLGLTATTRREICDQLQQLGCEVVNGTGLLERIRMVKTVAELDLLIEANRITEEAIDAAVAETRVGVSERHLFEVFRSAVQSQRAEFGHWFSTSGERSWALLGLSDRVLRTGDVMRIDGGCVYRGYTSDMGCSLAVGDPPAEVARRYDCLEAGFWAAAKAIAPGTLASEVFAKAVAAVREAGIPDFERGDVGHGLGREVFELPVLRPDGRPSLLFAADEGDFALETNMVLNVEIPYYVHGLGGYQIEKSFVVTPDGARPLGSPDTSLRHV